MSLETAFQQLREANPVPDPQLLTDGSVDFDGLLAATRQRSMEMQTIEQTTPETPQKPPRRPWLIAVAAAAAVILIGALLVIPNLGGGSSDVVDEEPPAPTTSVAPPTTAVPPPAAEVDVEAAFPIQVQNDQASRALIEFAGNTQELVEGGAHSVDIEMFIPANTNQPGVTVNLLSVDGELTSTGITEEGTTFTPTWAWTPDGNKVTVTMVGRGVAIPDTRPAVVVTVQGTPSSDPVEFVLTAESGSGRPG
jgi:hypothetical protein